MPFQDLPEFPKIPVPLIGIVENIQRPQPQFCLPAQSRFSVGKPSGILLMCPFYTRKGFCQQTDCFRFAVFIVNAGRRKGYDSSADPQIIAFDEKASVNMFEIADKNNFEFIEIVA